MKEMFFEGNNGGDYIRLKQSKKQEKKSLIDIEVGNCCVKTMHAQIPMELLTNLITKFALTNKHGFSRSTEDNLADFAKEVFEGYDKDFIEERCSHIKLL